MSASTVKEDARVERQILRATAQSQKDYHFDEKHDPNRPADFWFQESAEGLILFIVFYTQACRWSRCLGCNLPARMSQKHVSFQPLMAQVDYLLNHSDIVPRCGSIRKVIISNNGSVLDEATFPSSALIYLIAKLNLHLPNISILCLETRVEYVDLEELEFITRVLKEGETPTALELAIGFEAFDDRIRNQIFKKGLKLDQFEGLCHKLAAHGIHLKCYFMQKPVPGMTDEEAVLDIQQAIDYLGEKARECGIVINMHLNPTYVAFGTALEQSFRSGDFEPPRLKDVARAALHAKNKPVSIFLGLSDEGLACEGGSFIRPEEGTVVATLEAFNRTQDFELLRTIVSRY